MPFAIDSRTISAPSYPSHAVEANQQIQLNGDPAGATSHADKAIE
jgi:hypothetical protein